MPIARTRARHAALGGPVDVATSSLPLASLPRRPHQFFFILVSALHAGVIALLLTWHVNRPVPLNLPAMEVQIFTGARPAPESPPPPALTIEPPHLDLIVPEAPNIVLTRDVPVALQTAAAATTPVSTVRVPEPATMPSLDAAYLKNPPPIYPVLARRMREQGTVWMRVRVSQQGAALEVLLDQTSGSERLDSAAMDAVRRWRFVPARSGATAVEAWVMVPVEFKLQR